MAFINLERVDTNFGKTAPIKCPCCGNDFLVGADDSQSRGWPYLIHPRMTLVILWNCLRTLFTCSPTMKLTGMFLRSC